MKNYNRIFKTILCAVLVFSNIFVCTLANAAQNAKSNEKAKLRRMEDLGRGVVAVRTSSNVFISWRLLALDPKDIGFNVYRSTEGSKEKKLNSPVLTNGTNFTDTTADLTKNNTYYIKPVISGREEYASSSFTLTANHADEPCITIPLQKGGPIHFVWPGDFDGDHEYDYLIDRNTTAPQTLEAYKRDGTLLWTVNLGPNSSNQDNISPGSATIDVGHWDGANVYDLDGDGEAEVILKIANGVIFGDGTVWNSDDNNNQWLAVLDGMTGKLKATCLIPDDYLSAGPLACQLGIAYLNGETPSVIAFMKNRNADKSFNAMICAFSYDGIKIAMNWKWLRGSQACDDGHQMRIADVDNDGRDEICEIGFVIDDYGKLLYSLAGQNIEHGDRFYIGKLDKNSTGLQGYGIQQRNTKGVLEYYYDAKTGNMIWQHTTTPPAVDVGRGVIGDIDPTHPGYEVWSFYGIYNAATNTQISPADTKQSNADNRPYPAFRIWWDGDTLSESFNDNKIEKYDYSIGGDINNWDYSINRVTQLLLTSNYHSAVHSDRHSPMFYGDILGDWREEIIETNSDYSELVIFTTNIPTNIRIYSLAQNPLYRSNMSSKGYLESHLTDFYLGDGMDTPPPPKIYLARNNHGQHKKVK